MENQYILRGKKWAEVRAKAIFENDSKTTDWLLTQPAIVSDIKVYEDFLLKLEEAKTAGFNSVEEHEEEKAKKAEEARIKAEKKAEEDKKKRDK